MAKKLDIKRVIKRKIELTNDKKKIIIGKTHVDNYFEKKMRNEPPKSVKIEDKIRQNTHPRLSQRIGNLASNKQNTAKVNIVSDVPVTLRDYGYYVKEKDVDYDVVICVASYNRYNKIRRILKQLFTQKTKYTFKFCLINDGSNDIRYDNLQIEFPDIIYLKNDINGGKKNYWKTVNKLWSVGKQYKCHGFLQIDDDFILCDNFLNILMDEFFRVKEMDNSYMVFSYHIYGYLKDKPQPDWWYDGQSIAIDGGTLFDNRFLKFFDHYVDIGIKKIATYTSTFFWDTIVQHIKTFGVKVYRMPNSLVWHDGNFDSKLNEIARKTKKSYTKKFIDGENKYDTDRDLSDITFD